MGCVTWPQTVEGGDEVPSEYSPADFGARPSPVPHLPSHPRWASIWAQDRNRVLGNGHSMVWHVPADFQFFREQTLGCPIIMGRASFESIGRPLPGRTTIVLTRDFTFAAEGVLVAHSLDEAFDLGAQEAVRMEATTVWVTGGGSVYQNTMTTVDRLVVTELDLTVSAREGENLVYAPRIDPDIWTLREAESDDEWRDRSGDSRWRVRVYERKDE